MSDADLRDPAVAAGVLDSLRWTADQQIINHDGEHVWLKGVSATATAKGYITDCCLVQFPCERHTLVTGLS